MGETWTVSKSKEPRRPRLLRLSALAAGTAPVLALTLLPLGWEMNRFVVWLYYQGLHLYASPLTSWIYFDQLAFGLNVILTIPAGALSVWALPRHRWWLIGLGISAVSVSIELAQFLLPLGREGTWSDALANTIGGFLGAFSAHWWMQRQKRRAAAETTRS